MSYKRKLFSAIATGFAVVSFSSFASAQQTGNAQPQQQQDSTQKQERGERGKGFGKRGGRGHHGGKTGMRELAQLNLTDAQKQQIRTIMETNHKDGNRQNFQEKRQLMQAKRDGTITAEQETQLKNFKQQMRAQADATHQQILAVLTGEQRAQLEQIKQQRKEQKQQRRQMRQQNGQPKTDGDTQKDN